MQLGHPRIESTRMSQMRLSGVRPSLIASPISFIENEKNSKKSKEKEKYVLLN